MTFDSDPAARQFTFDYSADLTLCGLSSQSYVVTVQGEAGNVVKTSSTASFTLTLKNPCIDTNFVTITTAALPTNLQYILHDFEATGGDTFTHSAFSVVTAPFSHTLCGGLTYSATFNGATIGPGTKPPMAYDTATRTFNVYSEDFGLLGTKSITVTAQLTTYKSTATTPEVSTTIEIIDPCLDPFNLQPAM